MDSYVTRSVLVVMGLCALAVCLLVSIVDAFQRMDEFLRLAEIAELSFLQTLYVIGKYYLCLTLQYFIQFMVPFVSMLAGIIVVTAMCSHREFTALRASGVPLQRVLLPMVLAILLLGLAIFVLRDSVLPHLAREAHSVNLMMKPKGGKPVTLVLRDNQYIKTYMMGHFDPVRRKAYNFRLEIRDQRLWQQGRTDEYEVYTDVDPRLSEGKWLLGVHAQRYYQGRYGREMRKPESIPTRVTPAMLEQAALGPAVMTSEELSNLGDDMSMQVELAQRRAIPVAGTILLLVGVSMVLFSERTDPGSASGRAKSVIMAILLCAAYYLAQAVFVGFAESGGIGPNLAAWLPNLIFGSWAGYSFWRINI